MDKALANIMKLFCFGLLAYLSYQIVAIFIPAIIFAALFAVVFAPIHHWTVKYKISKLWAAVLVVALTMIFIFAPFATLVGLVSTEAIAFVKSLDQELILNSIKTTKSVDFFGYSFDLSMIQNNLQSWLKNAGTFIFSAAQSTGKQILNFGFQFFVFVFLYFYFLKDGENIVAFIKKLSPFEKKQTKLLSEDFSKVAKVVFVGNGVGALLAGLGVYIGFSIFGVGSPLIWAIIGAIVSLIPSLGTLVVYLIGLTIVAFQGSWWPPILLAAYYVVIEVLLVQNYLKPKFLDDAFPIHPVLVFFALVGGVEAFGSVGLIYGPLIMVIFSTVLGFIYHNAQLKKQ